MNSDLLIFKEKHDINMLEKIFTPDDIRDIRLTRKKFEEDINKTNDKKVFFSYIKYEIFLWKTITNKTRNINYHRQFAKMIINLHIYALKYHKDDLSIWLSYLKFCMEADFSSLLSDIFVQILCYHTDEHLWLLASKWELDEHNNTERALSYLNSALLYHPESSAIYCEIFRLELLENDSAKPETLFQTIETKLPRNVDLYISLFKLASKHIKLQNIIIEKMLSHFSNEGKLWEILANRELDGHHLSKQLKYSFIPDRLMDLRLKNHINKYKYAVDLINTETMWTKYLNTLLDLLEYEKHEKHLNIKDTFMEGCKKAHKVRLLSEDIYIKWIEYLQDENNENLLQILKEATKEKPRCLQLWVALVRFHMTNNTPEKIEQIFNDAIIILGDESIQIWRLKIQYYQLNLKSDLLFIEQVYRSAIQHSPTVANLIKPQFLDWLVLFKSDKAAYEEYEKTVHEKPWCLKFHKKMIELEVMCPEPKKEILENISRIAIEQFGKNTWGQYIHEEISCGPQWKRDVFTKYLLNLS